MMIKVNYFFYNKYDLHRVTFPKILKILNWFSKGDVLLISHCGHKQPQYLNGSQEQVFIFNYHPRRL